MSKRALLFAALCVVVVLTAIAVRMAPGIPASGPENVDPSQPVVTADPTSPATTAGSSEREPGAQAETGAEGIWLISLTQAGADLPPKRDDVTAAGIAGFDRNHLHALKPGDPLRMTLPEPAGSIVVTIDTVNRTTQGSYQVSGRVDNNRLHTFFLTLSENSMFATVGTRAGIYNLRGAVSHAWVFTGPALNHHVDPSVKDYRIPKQVLTL